MAQRLHYEYEPELFDIDCYNSSAIVELDKDYDKFVSQMKEGCMVAAE